MQIQTTTYMHRRCVALSFNCQTDDITFASRTLRYECARCPGHVAAKQAESSPLHRRVCSSPDMAGSIKAKHLHFDHICPQHIVPQVLWCSFRFSFATLPWVFETEETFSWQPLSTNCTCNVLSEAESVWHGLCGFPICLDVHFWEEWQLFGNGSVTFPDWRAIKLLHLLTLCKHTLECSKPANCQHVCSYRVCTPADDHWIKGWSLAAPGCNSPS